jgi:hypothetical protein
MQEKKQKKSFEERLFLKKTFWKNEKIKSR